MTLNLGRRDTMNKRTYENVTLTKVLIELVVRELKISYLLTYLSK